uniref:Regulatory protein zeste n=1 Tax=Parascaris univalens TaxID=6257 RepID=A0A915BJM6_PARUN
MLHFQQLSSGIKSQLSEMIEEKEKLKRNAKDDQDSIEAKKSRSTILSDTLKSEPINEQQNSESGSELTKEESIPPFSTSDMVHANAKTLAEVFGNNNQAPVTAADINRMNRERGLEIVSMASRYEALVDSASRSPAANMERNKIWHQITADINKKYPHLNMLTFEQCKKLCKYYKRKDPANYGLVLNTVTEEVSEPRDTNNFIGHLDEPIDDNEILEANDIVDGICKDALVASASAGELKIPRHSTDGSADELIIREDGKPSSDLLEFLAQCSASTSTGSADGLLTGVQAPISNQQKKERGQFVCKLAETFGTIFESHSRSYQVNAERNQVWKQIADATNEKYGAELGDLSIEQTKKLYANYKRKCQYSLVRSGRNRSVSDDGYMKGSSINGCGSVDVDSDASSSNSELLSRLVSPSSATSLRGAPSPSILSKLVSRDRMHNCNKTNGDVKNGLTPRSSSNKTLSTVELLAIIADRDAEIKQLKNELLQKSVEHQLQISRVIERMSELVKVAVNTNVQREIISSLGGMAFPYGGDAFSEKTFDDEADL